MVTISLLNMKGGVGKTTLAVNLAWHLCRRKKRKTLLVDLDPQFNSSQYLMPYQVWQDHRSKKGTVADLLIEPARVRMPLKKKAAAGPSVQSLLHRVEESAGGGVFDLLPSELTLARAVKNPQGVEYKLEKALAQHPLPYDYTIIDCAPTDSVLTATALMASDFILVPVKPDRFSVLGYGQILEALDDFRRDYPDPHKVTDLGVVFTQVQGNSDIEADCMSEIRNQAKYVFDAEVPSSRSYLRAVHEQTPVFDTRFARSLTKDVIDELVVEIDARAKAVGTKGNKTP